MSVSVPTSCADYGDCSWATVLTYTKIVLSDLRAEDVRMDDEGINSGIKAATRSQIPQLPLKQPGFSAPHGYVVVVLLELRVARPACRRPQLPSHIRRS